MSLLAIYLLDHHAAAVAGTRLARRVANVAPRDASGELSKVAKEIAEDLATLERFMGRLGTSPDRVKEVKRVYTAGGFRDVQSTKGGELKVTRVIVGRRPR